MNGGVIASWGLGAALLGALVASGTAAAVIDGEAYTSRGAFTYINPADIPATDFHVAIPRLGGGAVGPRIDVGGDAFLNVDVDLTPTGFPPGLMALTFSDGQVGAGQALTFTITYPDGRTNSAWAMTPQFSYPPDAQGRPRANRTAGLGTGWTWDAPQPLGPGVWGHELRIYNFDDAPHRLQSLFIATALVAPVDLGDIDWTGATEPFPGPGETAIPAGGSLTYMLETATPMFGASLFIDYTVTGERETAADGAAAQFSTQVVGDHPVLPAPLPAGGAGLVTAVAALWFSRRRRRATRRRAR